MLDRVENINNNPGFNKRRSNSYEKFIKKPYIQDLFGNDTMVFSPAAIYLSKLNWHLKEIQTHSDEKIFLSFYIDDFQFQIEIDFTGFYHKSRQSISISRLMEGKDGKNLLSVFLDFKKEDFIVNEEYKVIELNTIQDFFFRANDLFNAERFSQDKLLYKIILGNFNKEFYQEITYIFNSVLIFIDKMEKFNINKLYKYPKTKEELINIEQIRIRKDGH